MHICIYATHIIFSIHNTYCHSRPPTHPPTTPAPPLARNQGCDPEIRLQSPNSSPEYEYEYDGRSTQTQRGTIAADNTCPMELNGELRISWITFARDEQLWNNMEQEYIYKVIDEN